MSEKPRVIFENETGPKRVAFADLVPGKTYVAGEKIHIFMGEQDERKRSNMQDIASMTIHPGTEFSIDSKSSSVDSYKKIIFKNGPEIFLVRDCFPKEEVSVFEKSEDAQGLN